MSLKRPLFYINHDVGTVYREALKLPQNYIINTFTIKTFVMVVTSPKKGIVRMLGVLNINYGN